MSNTPSDPSKPSQGLPRDSQAWEEDEAALFCCGSCAWSAAFAAYEEDLRFAEEEERIKNARERDNGN